MNTWGEEEYEGNDRPQGEGWEWVGYGPGGKRWSRQTPQARQQSEYAQQQRTQQQQPQVRADNGPYYVGDDLIQARNQAVDYYHNAPYADTNEGELQNIQSRSDYMEQAQKELNQRLEAVNKQLDTSELRYLKISNPAAYAQRIAQIKQRHGFSPNTDTYRAGSALSIPYVQRGFENDRLAAQGKTYVPDANQGMARSPQGYDAYVQQRQGQRPQQMAQQPQYRSQPQPQPQYRPQLPPVVSATQRRPRQRLGSTFGRI